MLARNGKMHRTRETWVVKVHAKGNRCVRSFQDFCTVAESQISEYLTNSPDALTTSTVRTMAL